MVIDFKQVNKELYSADFILIDHMTKQQLGHMAFSNKKTLGLLSGAWEGSVFGDKVSLALKYGSMVENDIKKQYRPCDVFINDQPIGSMRQRTGKSGFLSKYYYHELLLKDKEFQLFTLNFGKEGARDPLFFGDRQIAQIEKEAVVYNALHCYQIFALDQESAMIAVLFSAYLYSIGFFKSGVKVTHSVEKYYFKTTNKYELSKYDPDFKMNNNLDLGI